ncbi:MAG: DegT/DnrJ/EryC1/StrS family aminotransferase, partial [Lachnospiraceae bacterium]|nr:DegT/DnrJ/EryC1/StrS family aminotransferase [Lachnospiraceae bacterium]
QGMMSSYKGKALGTIGDFGCLSFHETKNFSMGEGGCLFINERQNGDKCHQGREAEVGPTEGTAADNRLRLQQTIEQAEIIREKGTNRSKFFRGEIDKYTWVDAGSSYLPSELNAAYLWGQLEEASLIAEDRLRAWNRYYEALLPLQEAGKIELPVIPPECQHNGHIFYIKAKDLEERTALLSYLKENGVGAVFHYIPLHSAPAGKKYGRFVGEDRYTTKESERLVRLPMYYGITEEETDYVVGKIKEFYR